MQRYNDYGYKSKKKLWHLTSLATSKYPVKLNILLQLETPFVIVTNHTGMAIFFLVIMTSRAICEDSSEIVSTKKTTSPGDWIGSSTDCRARAPFKAAHVQLVFAPQDDKANQGSHDHRTPEMISVLSLVIQA